MNSFNRLAMAVFLATSILGTFATEDCDIEGFEYGTKKLTCAKMTATEDAKNKYCAKKKVQAGCRTSCGLDCDAVLQKSCPKKRRGIKDNCNKYEVDSLCQYQYVWHCDGDGSMECLPRHSYTCEDKGEGKIWSYEKQTKTKCRGNKKCEPKQCPPDEPQVGASCAWFQSSGGSVHGSNCAYDAVWTGCGFKDLECAHSKLYTCDAKLGWKLMDAPVPKCLVTDGAPVGQTCDITSTEKPQPPVEDKPEDEDGKEEDEEILCPPTKPGQDDDCDGIGSLCKYGYFVSGCTYETLECKPLAEATCTSKTEVDKFNEEITKKVWSVVTNGEEACLNPDKGLIEKLESLDGCDPDTFDGISLKEDEDTGTRTDDCPDRAPLNGNRCEDNGSSVTCGYEYFVAGCDYESLRCQATEEATCKTTSSTNEFGDTITETKWDIITNGVEACVDPPEDWPVGLACSPSLFNKTEYKPDDNELDSQDDTDDRGDDDEDLFTRSCPSFFPTDGRVCTNYMECTYYNVTSGCDRDTLACTPEVTARCLAVPTNPYDMREPEYKWEVDTVIAELCSNAPENWPSGNCDPETFDSMQAMEDAGIEPNESASQQGPTPDSDAPTKGCPLNPPNPGGVCHNDLTCSYGYQIGGCTPEQLGCTPIVTAYCEEQEPGTFLWSVESFAMERCEDLPPNWPAGECDPETFIAEEAIEAARPETTDSGSQVGPTDPLPESPPLKGCPLDQPSPGGICHGEMSCSYSYMVFGCTPETLGCGPIVTAYCEPQLSGSLGWTIVSFGVMQCGDDAPDIAGTACDPTTFNPAEAEIMLQI